jgi:hypothetical protein
MEWQANETQVPDSCIESAEYIIQSIYGENHGQRPLRWVRSGIERSTHVIANFGNRTICITATLNFHDQDFSDLVDYNFVSLPNVGEGLICLNKTSNLLYNMHLGAIVASNANQAQISNMMEQKGNEVKMVPLQTIKIIHCDDFREETFGSLASKYALGLLKPESPCSDHGI